MEAIKPEDKRKIKPRFIGTKKEKAKGQGRVVMINVSERTESSEILHLESNFMICPYIC